MAGSWEKATLSEARPGDRIRLESGRELGVTRVESPFFGRDEMIAIIEVTDTTWFKQPGRVDTPVEIWRES